MGRGILPASFFAPGPGLCGTLGTMLARSLRAVQGVGKRMGVRELSAAAAADGIPSHLRNLSGSTKPSVVLLYRCVVAERTCGWGHGA